MKRIAYCSIEDCEARCHGRGWCYKHYYRWRTYGDPLAGRKLMSRKMPPAERFWGNVAITADDTRCWEWQQGAIIGGYGVLSVNKKKFLATHYAWLLTFGRKPILSLLHSCDNPSCVNPKHLREGTDADNVFDMMSRGRSVSGHIYTADEVRYVLQRLADGLNPFQIKKETGWHYHSIRKIKNGTHWSLKLLKEDIPPSLLL